MTMISQFNFNPETSDIYKFFFTERNCHLLERNCFSPDLFQRKKICTPQSDLYEFEGSLSSVERIFLY